MAHDTALLFCSVARKTGEKDLGHFNNGPSILEKK
jgi:hypothetical protein